jgi:hypothetical protein
MQRRWHCRFRWSRWNCWRRGLQRPRRLGVNVGRCRANLGRIVLAGRSESFLWLGCDRLPFLQRNRRAEGYFHSPWSFRRRCGFRERCRGRCHNRLGWAVVYSAGMHSAAPRAKDRLSFGSWGGWLSAWHDGRRLNRRFSGFLGNGWLRRLRCDDRNWRPGRVRMRRWTCRLRQGAHLSAKLQELAVQRIVLLRCLVRQLLDPKAQLPLP